MKKTLAILLTVILTAVSLAGCADQNSSKNTESADTVSSQNTEGRDTAGSQSTLPSNIDIVYIYVQEYGADWIYGNDTFVRCGQHNYEVFNTVKVEYYKSDAVAERGTVTVDRFGDPYEGHYDKIITKVIHSRVSRPDEGEPVFDKPVIYLYPEKTTEVSVRLDFDGYFTRTIPTYRDGWHVTARPDGRIIADDGKTYPYLFWEGIPNREFTITEGFCVEGSHTREFLEKTLSEIGLAGNESDEFISFWLPRMENNRYNLISFCGGEYLEAAKLEITPAPDSVLRVFMAFRSSDEYVSLKEQTFTPFVRTGFTVVEWGGTCLG